MVKRLLLILFVLGCFAVRGTHLVGGEITYECMGGNQYEITLTIYRDCNSSGAPFDANAAITVYDNNQNLISNLSPPLFSTSQLSINAPSNCTQLPNLVCTEKGIYKTVVNLPQIAGGYVISHQRCCRNHSILNIPNPGSWGATYSTTIPGFTNCNSAPEFNDTPPVVLCLNRSLNLDMSATDSDGDSLHYELCSIIHGGGQSQSGRAFNSPAPDPASPPPYTTVPFGPGFSSFNPITSGPAISIDPQTGYLKGTPTQLGQYVFGICVTEYRNGVYLNRVRRDFQFNVTDQCNSIKGMMENQTMNPSTLCVGRTIKFKSISRNAGSVLWNFGDPNVSNDHSTLFEPTWTYSDTGTFTVTLIADPGSQCADTITETFKVYYPVDVMYKPQGKFCYEENELDFIVSGDFSPGAEFDWDFGGPTNHGNTSNVKEPQNVSFLEPGIYQVKLKVKDFGCEAVFSDSIYIFPFPEFKHFCPRLDACAPAEVAFHDSSNIHGFAEHLWQFGDGNISRDPSPVHTYTEPGTYTVTHIVRTIYGCKDTLEESFPSYIVIHPEPKAELEILPEEVSIYEPFVDIQSINAEGMTTETILPDGQIIEDLDNMSVFFDDTGKFEITYIAFNEYGCSDTLVSTIEVDAPLNFYIPSAFTPNNDKLNDNFRMSITGITDYHIRIFNRWGEMVFESHDLSISWNGNIRNGRTPAPAGLYTYQIIVETEEQSRHIKRHGQVTLMR